MPWHCLFLTCYLLGIPIIKWVKLCISKDNHSVLPTRLYKHCFVARNLFISSHELDFIEEAFSCLPLLTEFKFLNRDSKLHLCTLRTFVFNSPISFLLKPLTLRQNYKLAQTLSSWREMTLFCVLLYTFICCFYLLFVLTSLIKFTHSPNLHEKLAV